MKQTSEPHGSARDRILQAAFETIQEAGFTGASTIEIATRAHVSKRELYTLFDNKDELLLACISERAIAISNSLALPSPTTTADLIQVLRAFGYRLLKAVTRRDALLAFRFAIARSHDVPSAARILDKNGRRASRSALERLLEDAKTRQLLRAGETERMARAYFGLLWGDLQIGLLMGVAKVPSDDEMRAISEEAAQSFLAIYGEAGA